MSEAAPTAVPLELNDRRQSLAGGGGQVQPRVDAMAVEPAEGEVPRSHRDKAAIDGREL